MVVVKFVDDFMSNCIGQKLPFYFDTSVAFSDFRTDFITQYCYIDMSCLFEFSHNHFRKFNLNLPKIEILFEIQCSVIKSLFFFPFF